MTASTAHSRRCPAWPRSTLVATLASQAAIALGFYAFLLGMIGLVQFVPLLLLTPVVGLVADSVDRRWIIRGTTALLVLNAATLGLLTWAGLLSLPFLFLAAVSVGISRAFAGPAYSALAPNLVPKESLPTAIAISSIAWQTGTIAGPSVGGVLYALHPDIAYATISVLLMLALGLIFLIGPVPQPPVQRDRRPLQRILDGFAYVRHNRLVLAAITLDLFAVLLAGATALLPFSRAAASPAIVRSFTSSRSISATEARMWNSSRPDAVDVSNPSVSDRKSIPRSDRSAASAIRPWIERPSRSSFQITSVSPARAKPSASISPGRSIFAPLALSVNTFSHPAFVSASSCSVKS